MSTSTSRSHVYVGLAGETAPGRPIKSGLYRMRNDDGEWQLATRGLPAEPAISSGLYSRLIMRSICLGVFEGSSLKVPRSTARNTPTGSNESANCGTRIGRDIDVRSRNAEVTRTQDDATPGFRLLNSGSRIPAWFRTPRSEFRSYGVAVGVGVGTGVGTTAMTSTWLDSWPAVSRTVTFTVYVSSSS